MLMIDRMLEERAAGGDPIRVGMVGAGFMGAGVARQILGRMQGIDLSVICNRHPERAEEAYREAGVSALKYPETGAELDRICEAGDHGVTDDPEILCRSGRLDAVLEITGDVEFGARVAVSAIEHEKTFVTMSAELDGTVGAALATRASNAGVIYSQADGDQPGVTMNLQRFVRGIGLRPVVCGNIKGFCDPYRNPDTQEKFAESWGGGLAMLTSFADGTKVSLEQATIANATGMTVLKRGMLGLRVPPGTPIEEAVHWFPDEALMHEDGIVDFVVGASPEPGVFIIASEDDPIHRRYLEVYKLGKGPHYVFYRPYHLCHLEAPNSLARAVLLEDPTLVPVGPPRVEVVTAAKRALKAGKELDGIGGFDCYGRCETSEARKAGDLLPIGVARGCRLRRDVERDEFITYDDVVLPEDRTVDLLRAELDQS